MWIIKGNPTNITIFAAIKSIEYGYQQVSMYFSIESDKQIHIAIPFPWAPHKDKGGLKFIDTKLGFTIDQLECFTERGLGKGEHCFYGLEDLCRERVKYFHTLIDGATFLTNTDVTVYENPRKLKKLQNIELMHVQELCEWHLDDIGFITCNIEPKVWYQIHYTHKIASDSCLFFPTRLPSLFIYRNIPVLCELLVAGALYADVPKWLDKETSNDSGVYYSVSGWNWSADTRFNTDNWESSDDESSDDEINETDS